MMTKPITVSEIKEFLSEAEFAFRHQECATSEYYLGFLVQLKIDTDDEG